MQGAANPKSSCVRTPLLLRETIQHRLEEDGIVHVIFLDARKAFDYVWSDAMFVKLYECGVDAKLWCILKEWYRDLQCHVRIGNILSKTFQVLVGVFQGGKWSSRLFQIFYSELIKWLCNSLLGCNMYNMRVVCPTYADDIAIVAPYCVTLQKLLCVVERYASYWRLQFNPSKCAHMVFSKQSLPKSIPPVTLDGRVIELVSYTKHLGTGMGPESMVVENMIKKGRNSFYGILSLGKNIGGTNPAVANKLYWSTVIPSMLYGVQVLCLSEDALDSLEQEPRSFGTTTLLPTGCWVGSQPELTMILLF